MEVTELRGLNGRLASINSRVLAVHRRSSQLLAQSSLRIIFVLCCKTINSVRAGRYQAAKTISPERTEYSRLFRQWELIPRVGQSRQRQKRCLQRLISTSILRVWTLSILYCRQSTINRFGPRLTGKASLSLLYCLRIVLLKTRLTAM